MTTLEHKIFGGVLTMRLFDYETYEDYGKEFFFQVLRFRKFALIDLCFQIDDYPATEIFPFLIFSIGAHSLCGFSFRWKWFQIRLDFIQSRPRNFEWYRRGEDKYQDID